MFHDWKTPIYFLDTCLSAKITNKFESNITNNKSLWAETGKLGGSKRQVLGHPVCDRGAIPRRWKTNVVRSRLIILINEEINEANWMVSNSAKLDRRTKQHTQFGVSASNGSRDMAWRKSWRKKRKKKQKKTNEANWMVSNSAQLDLRTKQHTQFGVSASNGSRNMARTKLWRKNQK